MKNNPLTKSFIQPMAMLILSLTLSISAAAQSQELTLFQEVAQPNAPSVNQVRRTSMNQGRNNGPVFTLKSTSRFGDNYQASLLSSDGNTQTIHWKVGESIGLDGYDGFRVTEISSRSVSLRLPNDANCIESSEQGISCIDNGQVALLTISTSQALPSIQPEIAELEPEPFDPDNEDLAPLLRLGDESFELTQAQRDAIADRQQMRAERLNSRDNIRISADDVPDGMMIMRTPFGDRLVPANR